MNHPFKTPEELATRRYRPAIIKRPTMAVPAIATMEEAALTSFINDVAMGLVEMETIAARYGITVTEALELADAPGIAERIKTRRGVWESEDNVTERNRVCYGLIALDAAAVIDRQIHNPATPASVLIDAIKVVGRFGGIDGSPKGEPASGTGVTSSPVNIQINFSGGRTESVSVLRDPQVPPVIEGEAA